MNQILLTLQDLSKYYTTEQSVTVGLSHIDLAFQRGEFVAITGESGSGKSTMAHVLGGILRYEGGELLYGGKPTSHYDSADWERYRRDKVSFISQSYGILPGSSVLDNVTCALRLVGISEERALKDAEDILKKVELWDLRYRRAAKLSSGQKQRLSIARALAKPAPVLIADEPTGNLDAENSAMVISLLAEAARDRLVILITHEFSEAQDYVTRHIELHDGRVTMDAQLREVPELPAARPEEKRTAVKEKKHLSWFVSRFQIKARPVWAVLMLCLFAFTVFAMFATSGTFISNLDDTFTYYYDNSAFRNGDSTRIVIVRPDGGEFTQEDVDKLLSVRYVDSVEEYGFVTDIQYAYREGVDYEIRNSLVSAGFGDYVKRETYSVSRTQGSMPFVRTVPAMAEGKKFLTAGCLPESIYEVVAVGGEELLGQKITVLLQDQKNWGVDDYIRMEVTVVGVTDRGSHLYFHEDLGKMMRMSAQRTDVRFLYMPIPEGSGLAGGEGSWYDGYQLLKRINGGLTQEVGLLDVARQQVKEWIEGSMESIELFIDSFSMEGLEMMAMERFMLLHALESYATAWEIGDEFLALLKEVGLDNETMFASGVKDSGAKDWASMAGIVLRDKEISDRLNSVAEPLVQEVKALYEQKKASYEAQDVNELTAEELRSLMLNWWGMGDVSNLTAISSNSKTYFPLSWGRMPNLHEFHPIQPGEVLVSDIMWSTLTDENRRGKEQLTWTDEQWDKYYAQIEYLTFDFPIASQVEERTTLSIISTKDVGYSRVVLLHPEDFEAMTYPGMGEQISLFVEDYAYADRVLDAIHTLGYRAVSPYQEGAVTQNETLAEQRMQTLRVCLIALIAVIALQILLLRAMFSMETESYRLLSHIGLNGVTAQRSVLWQIMLFALGGQVLGVGAITACAVGGIDQVVHILRYLPLFYRVVLCLIHLGASAFTAVWTMKALKKQVFPESGAEPDLDWDSVGEEVEA